jgi:DNA polymerase alpha subunit B
MSQLYHYNYGSDRLGGQPLTMIVASGPFTLDASLDYEPFLLLVDRVLQEQPDLLVLVRKK